MKHSLKITLLMLALFLIAQYLGLWVVNSYTTKVLPYNIKPPEIRKETSFAYVFAFILVATALAILLARLRVTLLWKIWFFLAVVFTLSVAFSAIFNETLALIASLVISFFKVVRRNIIVHNAAELFMYGGLAAIFVPIFNMYSVSVLLVLISVYDYIAVRKTGHMVALAKFQASMHMFAGLFIPYGKERAILGGGDIGFPLLFTGVALRSLGIKAFAIPVFVALALFVLFIRTEKKKFYPAMPFLAAGCFAGYLIALLL